MGKLPSDIICLLTDSFQGSLSPSGRKRLQDWFKQHPEFQKDIGQLEHTYRETRDALYFQNIDTGKAWNKVNARTSRLPKWRRKTILRRYEIAAGFLIPLTISLFFLYRSVQQPSALPDSLCEQSQEIKKSRTQAILELSNGKQIALDASVKREIRSVEGIVIGVDSSNTLVVTRTNDRNLTPEKPNRIYVPVGGKYNVVLCDGTKVWVNSDSRFTFPNHFEGTERVVELSGEAYFEASKNGKPFIVRTGTASVRVLGTAFNVCSYRDEKNEQVTLVSGKVEVEVGEKSYALHPGQQLTARKSSAQIEIQEVDTDLYTSWRNDLFRFVDTSLEDITLKLKRWYNVRFVFQEEACKSYRFTGTAQKENDLTELMGRIQTANPHVQFKIKDDEIIISKK